MRDETEPADFIVPGEASSLPPDIAQGLSRPVDDEDYLMCKHFNFAAMVKVARLEDTGGFMAEITVKCSECDLPFQFLGLEPGVDTQGARVSIDGLEANIAICPQGAKPNPLQRMSFNINRFDG